MCRNTIKSKKGRARGKVMHGESNPASKLTKKQVRYLRHLRRNGWTLKELSNKYAVSIATVHRAINYVTWRSA